MFQVKFSLWTIQQLLNTIKKRVNSGPVYSQYEDYSNKKYNPQKYYNIYCIYLSKTVRQILQLKRRIHL